jgi:hypothetical protein
MKNKETILKENISQTILNFLIDNNINFEFCDPALSKTFIFKNKDDALKVLKYLFKYHRKYYYHLGAYKIKDKKLKDYESKIFIQYDDYLFNCVQHVKYYYINFLSYIYVY